MSPKTGPLPRFVPGRLLAFTVLGGLLAAGCGSGEPFDYVEISGKVTYQDGTLIPADRIMVTFIPQAGPVDPKTHPRPGMAEVNVVDGTFDMVTSHRCGDGVVPGKHKVLIVAMDSREMITDAVPPQYHSAEKTPLEVEANSGSTYFELKVERPVERLGSNRQ